MPESLRFAIIDTRMAKKRRRSSKDGGVAWISNDLKPTRLWLKRIGKVLGFTLHLNKYDDDFGFILARRRWWYSLESDPSSRVGFPGDLASFSKHAFNTAEDLLHAVLVTKTLLVYNNDAEKNSSAFFFDNSTLAGTRSREELELKLALLGER